MSEMVDDYLEFREGDFGPEPTDMLGGAVTLRSGTNGRFDELVAHGVDAHFEMMSDGQMWVCLTVPSVKTARVVFWIDAAKRRLKVAVDQETDWPAGFGASLHEGEAQR